MKSEVAFFKDKRALEAKAIIDAYKLCGFTDEEIIAEMKRIKAARSDKPSPSDVSVTENVLMDIKKDSKS